MNQPNVLLLILDSVRARNTSLHGHANETTPFLTEFAESATVYTQARAPSTWSLPSHVSIFTGLYPSQHRLTDRDRRLDSGHTVWETLAEYGYATGVFSSNPFLTAAPVGLRETFETVVGQSDLPFEDALDPREFVREHGTGQFTAFLQAALASDRPLASLVNGGYEKLDRTAPGLIPAALRSGSSGERFAAEFLDWAATQSGPWAACLNFMDAHQPYEPADEYNRWGDDRLRRLQNDIETPWEFNGGQRAWWQRRALEALYDGAIHQVDAVLADLIDELADRGVLSETLVIVTGDHGEGFGEPSEIRPDARAIAHGNGGSHEVLLHVPLVVRAPGQTEGDTVETVCSLAHLRTLIEETVDGTDDPAAVFPPDEPVVASAYGLNERMRSKAEEYCDDLTAFEGDAQIVYEDGETVQKHLAWRDERVTVEIRDAQTSYRVGTPEDAQIQAVFERLTEQDVTGQAEGVDETVQQRLEDLGYA